MKKKGTQKHENIDNAEDVNKIGSEKATKREMPVFHFPGKQSTLGNNCVE